MSRTFLASVALALISTGCATSLASLETAEALKPGSIAPEYSMSISAPTSAAIQASQEALDIYQSLQDDPDYTPSEDEARTLLKYGFFLALYPPGAPTTFGVRVGVLPGLELGLRRNGGFAFNAKYQLIDGEHGDLALVGEYQSQSASTGTALDYFADTGFSATSLMGRMIYSQDYKGVFKPYAHLTARRTNYEIGGFYDTIADVVDYYTELDLTTNLYGKVQAFGGGIGGSLGYKYVFLSAELTGMRVAWQSTIIGEPVALDGWVFYPAVGAKLIIPSPRELRETRNNLRKKTDSIKEKNPLKRKNKKDSVEL